MQKNLTIMPISAWFDELEVKYKCSRGRARRLTSKALNVGIDTIYRQEKTGSSYIMVDEENKEISLLRRTAQCNSMEL